MSRILAALAVITLIAGCSGSHGQFSPTAPGTGSSAVMQGVNNAEQPGLQPDTCRHIGIITLNPCPVNFTSSGPKYVVVTVMVHHHVMGTVVEHNDCGGLTGIAKITRRTNLRWAVTAGAMDGTCHARFVFYHNGNNEGFAELRITNSI